MLGYKGGHWYKHLRICYYLFPYLYHILTYNFINTHDMINNNKFHFPGTLKFTSVCKNFSEIVVIAVAASNSDLTVLQTLSEIFYYCNQNCASKVAVLKFKEYRQNRTYRGIVNTPGLCRKMLKHISSWRMFAKALFCVIAQITFPRLILSACDGF